MKGLMLKRDVAGVKGIRHLSQRIWRAGISRDAVTWVGGFPLFRDLARYSRSRAERVAGWSKRSRRMGPIKCVGPGFETYDRSAL